jgi:Domain of unknown function (DUF5658)
VDKRRVPDRRRRPTPALSRYTLRGRRRGGRRKSEARNIYVDQYRPWEGGLVLLVVTLCALDVLLTLDVIQRGGEEWNPVMRLALGLGVWPFVIIKMLVTGVGSLVLLVRVRFRGMRFALCSIAVLYLLLMGWHAAVRADFGDEAQAAAVEGPP